MHDVEMWRHTRGPQVEAGGLQVARSEQHKLPHGDEHRRRQRRPWISTVSANTETPKRVIDPVSRTRSRNRSREKRGAGRSPPRAVSYATSSPTSSGSCSPPPARPAVAKQMARATSLYRAALAPVAEQLDKLEAPGH